MRRRLRYYLLWLIILSVGIVSAQGDSCPELVTEALAAVDNFCTDLGRNQACYGNVQLSAEAQPNVENFIFDATGDIVDVADILTLELNPMDISSGTWGVAVMSLQADIPNSLPGQNVTFILFGDVYIENASSEEQNPMQAFYLRTGIGDSSCEEAPDSGLLIQTPDGVDEVAFNVNGVDVNIGSTVLFQTEGREDGDIDMLMSTVEGTGVANFEDENYPAIAGTRMRVPLNNELLPIGRPDLPESYDEDRVRPLPINPLPRRIDIAPPLPPDGLNNLHDQFQNGQLPCGLPDLPDCNNLPPSLQNGGPPPIERWGQNFEPGLTCVPRSDDGDETSADLPPLSGAQPLPPCPPTSRADRPDHVDPLAMNPDGDRDNDNILNGEDACPYELGLEEFQGCPQVPDDSDEDGIPDRMDACPDEAGSEEFHGCLEAPEEFDSDEDGIPDNQDFCPNRAGLEEFRGCPARPGEDRDSDEDGISDAEDFCPYHQGLPEFDGCPEDSQTRDSDGDGVPDAVDRCPNRRGSEEFLGCPDDLQDSDEDGIPDALDRCPNLPGLRELDGCPDEMLGRDSDEDGVPDSEDRCPNFAGIPELGGCPDDAPDGDEDGIPDALDRCPNLSGLREFAGCPEAAQDSDGDGFRDFEDECPDEFGEDVGCPVDDTPPDSDGDGIFDDEDLCPNQAGLSEFRGCPDNDGDGIPDPLDRCSNLGDAGWGLSNDGCPLPPPDSDGDGIRDPNDACPNQGDTGWGLSDNGCPFPPPDSDGDGFSDPNDACPNQGDAGWGLSNNGCPNPPPDSDGDGVYDPNDRCPNQAGLSRYDGCPDSDGDGIPDPLDQCRTEAGPASNGGCPVNENNG